jgi:hypothetical protein
MVKETITKMSGKDIVDEISKLGIKEFACVAGNALRDIDHAVKTSCHALHDAYADESAKSAVALTNHATICFSVSQGELQQMYVGGSCTGIKQLCDMLPAWFQEHYEVMEDGRTVKPLSK